MRALRRLLLAFVVALLAVGAAASPAGAHGVAGVQPSNYETRILSVEPQIQGIDVRVVDLGDRLELTNDTGREVTVLGYDGEPYLRVGPSGIFENVRSPAAHLNEDRTDPDEPPPDADPEAEPEWRRVGGGRTVAWHDHRAHWMGAEDPPVVTAEPNRTHVLQEWTVTLLDGRRPVVVRGDLRWVPGPSPWPWVGLAVGLAALVVACSRTRRWRWVLALALGVLAVAETAHVLGLFGATTASVGSKLAASAYAIGGVVVALAAVLELVRRRDPYEATPIVVIAGVFLFVGGGLADLTALARSQIPSSLPAWGTRVAVALNLGLGAGLVVAAGLRLRRPSPQPAPPA